MAAFWSRLSIRERRFVGIGAPAMAAIILTMLLMKDDRAAPGEAAPAIAERALPPPSMPPAPTEPASPPAAVWPPGISLHGISARPGGGAIIVGHGDGRQRRIRIGRTIVPGWTLSEVGAGYAVAAADDGTTRRLDMRASSEVGGPGPGDRPADSFTRERQTMSTALSLGMELAEEGGFTGYRLTAAPQALVELGLRDGDILVQFDDDTFDEPERISDLAAQLALGRGGTLSYLRDGQERTVSLAP